MDENLLVKSVVIEGFLVVVDEKEQKLFREAFNSKSKEIMLTTALGGLFYKKEKLLNTLLEHHENFLNKETHIVEIEVEPHCIATPNGHKFGIKKGKGVPIRGIQTYQEALKQIS